MYLLAKVRGLDTLYFFSSLFMFFCLKQIDRSFSVVFFLYLYVLCMFYVLFVFFIVLIVLFVYLCFRLVFFNCCITIEQTHITETSKKD